MSNTVPTPAKLKAYLSGIKESFLDESSPSLSAAFRGVLKMELVLRGVLVQDDARLWSQIQSSVGKTLLVEQSQSTKIPKALLAGANVMAGRVAEAFYNQLVSKSPEIASSFSDDILPYEETMGARQRADDIHDERFIFLLWHCRASSSKRPPSSSNNDIKLDDYLNGILQIALGYYNTAAEIQSDTPPMWKKLLDTWTRLENEVSLMERTKDSNANNEESPPPHEAHVAIENLIRIAQSKKNTKRASELQLRLVQSYLNPDRITLVGTALEWFPKASKGSTTASNKSIAECFGASIPNSLSKKKDGTRQVVVEAEKALSTLKDSESYFEPKVKAATEELQNDFPPDVLLYQALKVQSYLAQEDAKVQEEAFEMHRRSSSLSSQDNLTDCSTKCHSSLVLSTFHSKEKTFHVLAELLRDLAMAAWANWCKAERDESKGPSGTLRFCLLWLNKSIHTLYDRADIIARETGSVLAWKDLLFFIMPIVKDMESQIGCEAPEGDSVNRAFLTQMLEGGSIDEISKESEFSPVQLVDSVVSILPTVVWMLHGDKTNLTSHSILNDELNFVGDVMSGFLQWQETIASRRHQQKTNTLAVGSKESDAKKNAIRWQNAIASAQCLSCQDDNSRIQSITVDAIKRGSGKNNQRKGFLPFLQCMVAWSGWFRNPWPYCTNLADARMLLANAEMDTGRPLTSLEEMLLRLAKADAEVLNGGFMQEADKHYNSILAILEDEECLIDSASSSLLRIHCYNGKTRIQHASQNFKEHNDDELSYTGKCLEILESLKFSATASPLLIWNTQSIFPAAKAHQLSVTRQLIADSLIHFGRFGEARCFLQNAVADSPLDADAALALGAFLLRVSLYELQERTQENEKEAQIHLLKAAKLDPTKPNPFALLGIWYEEKRDLKRAKGCFMKCLRMDPCNPIAGRGLLRVSPNGNHNDVFDSAINSSSPLNGWAWRSVGLNKAYCEGDDALALVAMLKALRCQDIALPEKDSLEVFYATPSSKKPNEKSGALAEVGMCYRRLGRMTASIRAFRSSIEAGGVNSVQSKTLIACAQVEQELGLFDEAAERYSTIILRSDDSIKSVALYGHALALFAKAERDLMDGKAGASLAWLELAVADCLDCSNVSVCKFKLLGDLYSFGASLPSHVFLDDEDGNIWRCTEKQLEFVSKGESAYRSALEIDFDFSLDDDEAISMKSSALSDIALNILLQAQILSSLGDKQRAGDTYKLSSDAFRRAIEFNPIHAASWCGLGCSVLKTDPLLAQHAFCRCIEIDNVSPDAYANAGFLYTSQFAANASRSTMEALTQVADTPMMWINCAFLLEREAAENQGRENLANPEDLLSQAADAYRASLQVMRQPEAQLGLSLTGRIECARDGVQDRVSPPGLFSLKRKDSFSFMQEYVKGGSKATGKASFLEGIMEMEKGLSCSNGVTWKREMYTSGREKARQHSQGEDASILLFDDSFEQTPSSSSIPPKEHLNEEDTSLNLDVQRIQRKIWCQPDRADLWLLLAKSFVEQSDVESAKAAATRATNILWLDLTSPSEARGESKGCVDRKIISEAFSLRSWLNELGTKELAPYDVQRALFMDPTNTIARTKLLAI